MSPPKWADRFLEWYCDPALLEDLQGDLYEVFEHTAKTKSQRRAKMLYCWLVLRSFRISAVRKNSKLKNSRIMMTKNNFKIALRILWKDRFNSAVNLLGLTIGITCFLLLGLYVKQELSYDTFHTKKDRIYRSWLKEDYGDGRVFFNSHTPLRFESLFEDNFPEVAKSVQYIEQTRLVGRGEDRINEKVSLVSPDFFEVFDFKVVEGNLDDPLPEKSSLVISQSYAKKYFGRLDPVGLALGIQVGNEIRDFNISAVFEDMRKESSIQFDLAISTENCREFFGERSYQRWFSVIAETYVLMDENASINSVEEKMQDVVLSQLGSATYGDESIERDQYKIGFQQLTDIHLNPEIPLGYAPVGNPQYVLILGIIGVLVLAIAAINYTTLSTGQSIKRAKEVGVRKAMGAMRSALIGQYLSESVILGLLAMFLALVASFLMLPIFNELIGADLVIGFDIQTVTTFLALGIAIGVISGTYPALVISAQKVLNALKNGSSSMGKLGARSGLVVIQFAVTVFLISTTLIMRQQLNFLKNKDLGYQYSAAIAVQLNADPNASRLSELISSGMQNGELLKARLEKYPEIDRIAMGSHVFGTNGWANLAYTDRDGVFRRFRLLVVDPHYLSSFEIDLIDGRDFEVGNSLDTRQSVILNQKAVKLFGLENPVGSKLPGQEFGEHQIVGVVKDFHFSSLHSEVEPLVIVQNAVPIFSGISDSDFIDSIVPKLVFTYSGGSLLEATDILRKEWEAIFPNEKWNYHFIDDRIKGQYDNEVRMGKLLNLATALSILIASLGLLGLSMLVVNRRIKEISIRKVMGASSNTIFGLLAKGFVFQLLTAIAVSIPVTILLVNSWLESFAYRVNIGAYAFVASAFATLLLGLVVISYHTMRAVRVNPAESLRNE